MDHGISQEEYIRHVLEAYRKTPGTVGTVRRADRLLATQLYQRGLSVKVIENALVLAAARRLIRPPDAPALGHDSLAGLLLAGNRGTAGAARQSELLRVSPPQACTLGIDAVISDRGGAHMLRRGRG